MIDTHCHIHDDEFDYDFEPTVSQALKNGVKKMICVGTDLSSSVQAQQKCDSKTTFPTVGLHPHDANKLEGQKEALKQCLDKNTVAIGECGLDYFYMNSSKEEQAKAFRWQIDLALNNKLPLILHIRGSKENKLDAFNDALHILSDYSGVSAVVHSYYLDIKLAKRLQSLGYYLGLNGIITFSKDHFVEEMIKGIDQNGLVLETDAPFLSPKPHRGKTNQPHYIFNTAEYIANIRDIETSNLVKTTTDNAERLFRI